MPNSQVTILMPVYNRENYISHAIESVRNQTLQDWRLLLINDGSTDGTQQLINSYLDDDRISCIANSMNLGVGKTLNLALQHVETPYFMIVDSDDWIEENTLQILLQEMELQPLSTSLICANAKVWKEDADGELSLLRTEIHRSFKDKYDFLFYGPMLTPRFFRTESVRRIGGFETDDPQGGRFNEDRYLLLKLISGSQFHHVDQNLYNIRVHANNVTKPENRVAQNQAKQYIITTILKHWGEEVEPIFYLTEDGWLDVKELRPKRVRNLVK